MKHITTSLVAMVSTAVVACAAETSPDASVLVDLDGVTTMTNPPVTPPPRPPPGQPPQIVNCPGTNGPVPNCYVPPNCYTSDCFIYPGSRCSWDRAHSMLICS